MAKVGIVILCGKLNFTVGSVTDEDRFATPLDGGRLPEGDGSKVNLDRAQGEDVGRRRHGVDELEDGNAHSRRGNELGRAEDKVGERTLRRVARHVSMRVVVVVVIVACGKGPGRASGGRHDLARLGVFGRRHGRGCRAARLLTSWR